MRSPSVPRTRWAASSIGRSARWERNSIASKTLDFPMPFSPAMHVNGPNCTSRSSRFLNPVTSRRVSMARAYRPRGASWRERATKRPDEGLDAGVEPSNLGSLDVVALTGSPRRRRGSR